MQKFVPGQRWISSAELQMGLGTVLATEHRTVTILFMATGETRTYAKQSAPLSRVEFSPGDTVTSHEGWRLQIESVREEASLLTYHGRNEQGQPVELPEGQLNNFIQLSRPTERLFNGQIDADRWFDLRYQTQQALHRLAHSDLRGLTGGRTSPIPHQLYIAHEVANRYAPRVLLADEVGLGKTIEAGMILHQQLITERAGRVLILVPESLVHQWLVEMLRRFNLFFSIFDEDRCEAIEEHDPDQNPFHTAQLVLCNLEFLAANPDRAEQALAGDWDLLVVDEAHHLQWSPQQSSPEYELVANLTAATRGVLLLTATPEQLGKEGHFARLRLLDPDRFADFTSFVTEEAGYEPTAQAVEELLGEQALSEASLAVLRATFTEGDNRGLLDTLLTHDRDSREHTEARDRLVAHLLDRHGTGRILFRNTRAAIQGFPARQLNAYPLPMPEVYPGDTLTPERAYQDSGGQPHWTQLDPRIPWLCEQLTALKPEKVLVITATADSALEIADALRSRTGIYAAVFHEHMSLLERDRAGAYFADHEYGTQVLVCSEIGSEGRNFQFAHHLVLFDLPLNPDLLEQRIGRLDRIGQTDTIQIHVPYLDAGAQALLFRWYQHGLDAFEQTCPAGHSVFVELGDELRRMLQQADNDDTSLIEATQQRRQQLSEALHRGRDRLLEYQSCRPQIAAQLRLRAEQEDATSNLAELMDRVFDAFGVQTELHSQDCLILKPGEQMISAFPGLPEDGMTITFSRATALANEDVQFLTWDHPMVTDAMDLVLTQELGNSALTAVKYPGVQPGTLLVECLFLLESAARSDLQSSRYLPPTTVRVVIDERGRRHDNLGADFITAHHTPVDPETAAKVVRAKQQALRDLLAAAERQADEATPALKAQARQQGEQILLREIHRLQALQQVNPNVRDEEIAFFERQLTALIAALDAAQMRLDAVRVLVAT